MTPEVEFIRRLPALVLVDVPRGSLTHFGEAVRKAYADYFEPELPRVRIVVTTHGATPMQVASAIHRKVVCKNPKRRNPNRAREIVKLAAKGRHSASQWLKLDERGTWEQMARTYLEDFGDKMRARGASEKDVDEGIALMLRLAAIEALLRDAKRRKNPYLGRHGLAHPEHPMLGLDKEQVRATKEHLRKLQEARKAGYKGAYPSDPQWLVEQAINRRGGYADDPHARGSAIPVRGKFPKKGGGDWQRHAWQIAQAVNSPRRRVYESELGEWGPELKKRLPGRFSRYGEDD